MKAVFLSPLAEKKLMLLLYYLESEWSKKSRDAFLKKLLRSFNSISIQPESCVQSQEIKNLYKCVVTKQTSFYYRILDQEIEIITISDNRQHTDKLRKELGL